MTAGPAYDVWRPMLKPYYSEVLLQVPSNRYYMIQLPPGNDVDSLPVPVGWCIWFHTMYTHAHKDDLHTQGWNSEESSNQDLTATIIQRSEWSIHLCELCIHLHVSHETPSSLQAHEIPILWATLVLVLHNTECAGQSLVVYSERCGKTR